MELLELRNVTNVEGHGPPRSIIVGGVRLRPGQAHSFPPERVDKYTLQFLSSSKGLAQVGQEPVAVSAPVPQTAAPVEDSQPVGLEDVLQELTYASLVELHDLVADSPYSGRRGKARVVEALLELDEGDILAALE